MSKKFMQLLALIFLLLITTNILAQQTKTVHGYVLNNNNEPIESVTIKNKNKIATSNEAGYFKIDASIGDTIIFKIVGYGNQIYPIQNFNLIKINLHTDSKNLESVTVVGSRSNTQRVNFLSPIPVDKLSHKDLVNVGQIEVGEMLQYIVPSFNANRTTVNSIANYAAPATLKGLGPDQTLVLIEGKREHQFSAVNNAVTVGKGTVTTDMNVIPAIAIENVEVLKDGAAAQYGSDAIAGIINIGLRKSVQKLTIQNYTSITSQGDGFTKSLGINYGIKLSKKGYLNLSAFYLFQEETNRADNFTSFIYSKTQRIEDSTRLARKVYPITNTFKVNTYGLNRVEAKQFYYNLANPIFKDWQIYSFGGYSDRYITSWGFLRNALPSDPTTNPAIYPDGYLPILPGQTIDYNSSLGIRRKTKLNWNYDLSSTFGGNYLDFWAYNTSNPSLGASSPKNFYLGRTLFNQLTYEFNVSKQIPKFLFLKNFSFATGIQNRIDYFEMRHGDSASYIAGPLAYSQNKSVGSTGRPGLSVDNETNQTRTNTGVYVDVEGELTKKWLITTALRYENYSDFGSNISYKFASIYQINNSFGFRASVNKGFRAPSLQQIYNGQTSSTAQAGTITLTENLRSNDPRLQQIGINYPKPEISYSYNIGGTYKLNGNPSFKASIDAYQINIYDRIVVSEILSVKDIPILPSLFPTQSYITFFTNQINTTTQGVDFVGNYNYKIDRNNSINIIFTYTYNQTKISKILPTPDILLQGVNPNVGVSLFDTISIALIENAQPKNKWILNANYTYKKFTANFKTSYIGEVTTYEKAPSGYYRSQVFSGKYLFDCNFNYILSPKITIQLGVNNIFDTYPEKINPIFSGYNFGQVPYTRNAFQFPLNGRTYFLNVNFSL